MELQFARAGGPNKLDNRNKPTIYTKLTGGFQDYLVSPKLYQAPFLNTTPTASEESSMHPCTQNTKVGIVHPKTSVIQLLSQIPKD